MPAIPHSPICILQCAAVAALAFAAAVAAAEPSPPADPPPEPWLAERLEWFQDLRFGLFIHWGIYSQWGCIESWPLVEVDKWARPDDLACWVERGKDMERFKRDYFALNRTFDPGAFDPAAWAAAAQAAGMKYVVFTTKHHDGFSMFDTRQTDFRVTHPDCPYSRRPQPDITRAVFDAFRARGFGLGAYFSKSDWHAPGYWDPARPARTRNPNYDTRAESDRWAGFVRFVHGQVEELMSNYGPVDILWLDGGQVRPPDQDIRMDDLAAMARKHQPGLIIVDRTVGGRHENYRTPEQQVPDKPLPYVWESCLTMGDQWSYKHDDNYKSVRQLVHLLVDVVSKGGNLLLNIGPRPDGRLPDEALQRLAAIGRWMDVNSQAIHATRPVAPYKDGRVCLTSRPGAVYAIVLAADGESAPPAEVSFAAPAAAASGAFRPTSATLLGDPQAEPLPVRFAAGRLAVTVPARLVASPPCADAWVLKMAR